MLDDFPALTLTKVTPMQFKRNIIGYLLVGLAFLFLVIIPFYFLMAVIATPLLVGGLMTEMPLMVFAMLGVILIVGLIVMGWLIFRFVKGNKFG